MKKLMLLAIAFMLTASSVGCRNACGWRRSWFQRDECCCPTYDSCGCSSCGSTYGTGEVIYGGIAPGPVTTSPSP